MKVCKNCQRDFEINDKDRSFYKKLEVNEPSLCMRCRQQRRLAWRNERWMYKRKCDFSAKDIISMYPPDSPFKVYDTEIWWSDKWDSLEYGRDFDFSRPFFEQFRDLQLAVPRAALVNKQSENCHYTNHAGKNRNCYLSGCIFGSEDCYYSDWVMNCKNCVDCSYLISHDEIAYETYYAWNSQRVFVCDFIRQCVNLWFCFDCVNVQDSFMCWNLRNKRFCIRNRQYSKAEYEAEMSKIFPLRANILRNLRVEYIKIKNEVALRSAVYTMNSENSLGDLLFETKNVYYGFDSINCEDCRYIFDAIDVKDSMDLYHIGWAELIYESHAISNGYFCRFCHFTYDNAGVTYCDCTQNCKNLFGCAGLVRKEYCILNKQYSRPEYEKLVTRIIEHMKETGEWGEFFPMQFSPFAYNQSRVQEYFPLKREAALARGFRWSDYEAPMPTVKSSVPAADLPEKIEAVTDDILAQAIICEKSGRPFGIIKEELAFYRENGIPLPRRHRDQRYLDRIEQRLPRDLWQRDCTKCGRQCWTSQPPGSLTRMICKECYLKEVQ